MRGRSLAGHFDPEALSRKAASAFLLRRPNVRSADIHQIELCDRSWPRLTAETGRRPVCCSHASVLFGEPQSYFAGGTITMCSASATHCPFRRM